MPEVLADLVHLPLGSHCVSFHASREEAADHAARFLAGTPSGQAASYWVPDASLIAYYDERVRTHAPQQVGCVQPLGHEQVDWVDGKLRPTSEVSAFVRDHPEGVTAAGETLSLYWTSDTIPQHLEYEQWFDEQPREHSRFLCPYDLRKVPPDMAPNVLRELGAHHSHALLSDSQEPAVRLLQLFVFGNPDQLPAQLTETYQWAVGSGFVEDRGPREEMSLTRLGELLVRDWESGTTIEW